MSTREVIWAWCRTRSAFFWAATAMEVGLILLLAWTATTNDWIGNIFVTSAMFLNGFGYRGFIKHSGRIYAECRACDYKIKLGMGNPLSKFQALHDHVRETHMPDLPEGYPEWLQ